MTPEQRAAQGKRATLAVDASVSFGWAFLAVMLADGLQRGPGHWQQALAPAVGVACVFLMIVVGVFTYRDIHHQVWRHMGWSDAVAVGEAALIAISLFLCVYLGLSLYIPLPMFGPVVLAPVWVLLLFATRMLALWRSTDAPFKWLRQIDPDAPSVLLVGKMADVSRVLRDPGMSRSIRALGIIALDAPERGRAINGIPLFGGPSSLGDTIALMTARYGSPPRLALASADVASEISAERLVQAAEAGAKPMVLTGRGRGEDMLSALRPADLLLRPERQLDPTPVRQLLDGRRVLVTGAGGSIGQALVMAALPCSPAEIVAYDSSEYNLYALGLALEDAPRKVPFRLAIGNIREPERLRDVMDGNPPAIVLHAAALKHVPLVEANAAEAVLTNVQGLIHVARAAANAGAQRFVLISSDKAVSPTNTMGATKRLAERVMAGLALEHPGMAVSVVRFGNVLGSSGSVVPRFESQIRAGGPVTVSHPEATRFFMTIGEAANLVLQAAAQNGQDPGEAHLFMLDMGKPIRVLELAETMIRLAGRHPYSEIPIVFSGRRAGDRMHEALVRTGETLEATPVIGLNRVRAELEAISPDDPRLVALFDCAHRRDEEAVRTALRGLVPGYEGGDADA